MSSNYLNGADAASAERATTFQFRNACSVPLNYYLEPWGTGYVLLPGATFTLISNGPHGEYLEVEVGETSVTTWSQTGTTVKLLDGDVTLMVGDHPVPPYPRSADEPPLPESAEVPQEIGIVFTNGRDQSLTIVADLEELMLPVRTQRAVIFEGTVSSPIEIEFSEESVLIHGWPGAVIGVTEERATN